MSASEEISEEVLNTFWGLWRELGVPGSTRFASSGAVDIEWLLVLTPTVFPNDARLEDLVSTWAVQNHTLIGTRRLRAVAKAADDRASETFWQWAKSLGPQVNWLPRAKVKANTQHIASRELVPDLARPPLVHLRARAVFGVGSRADLVCELLSRPEEWVRAAGLADVGYTRRNIARVLADFADGLLVDTKGEGSSKLYRLRDPSGLSTLLHADEVHWPTWKMILPLALSLLRLAKRLEKPAPLVRIETTAALTFATKTAKRQNWDLPKQDQTDAAALLRWGAEQLRLLRGGQDGLHRFPSLEEAWFMARQGEAERRVAHYMPAATMEVRASLRGKRAYRDEELLTAIREAEIPTFGWPLGILLENRPEFAPKPLPDADGIQAVVAIDDASSASNAKSFDTWSCRVNGDYYLLKTLFEDQREPTAIFFNTRMVRVAEALLHAASYYSALKNPSNTTLVLRITHSGLEGRMLKAAGPASHYRPRGPATAVASSVELSCSISDIQENTAAFTQAILDPMFRLFHFATFDKAVYAQTVERYKQGVVS